MSSPEAQGGAELHLDSLYRDVILEHFANPQGAAPIGRVDVEVEGYNPLCGDEVVLRLALGGRGGSEAELEAVSVKVEGCTICRASGSMMWELVCGRKVCELRRLVQHFKEVMHGAEPDDDLLEDAVALSGVAQFPVRIKCALLPWTTLEEAFEEIDAGAPERSRDKPGGKHD